MTIDDDDNDDAYLYHDVLQGVLQGVLHTECAVIENGVNVR